MGLTVISFPLPETTANTCSRWREATEIFMLVHPFVPATGVPLSVVWMFLSLRMSQEYSSGGELAGAHCTY